MANEPISEVEVMAFQVIEKDIEGKESVVGQAETWIDAMKLCEALELQGDIGSLFRVVKESGSKMRITDIFGRAKRDLH